VRLRGADTFLTNETGSSGRTRQPLTSRTASAGRAAPAAYFIDRDVVDSVPASAVDALDPDARVPLERRPLWFVFLPETEFGRCDLEIACCRPDVQDLVVAGRHLLTAPLRDP
jgi:hypothetical protein